MEESELEKWGVSKHTIHAWKAKYGGNGCEPGAGSQAAAG